MTEEITYADLKFQEPYPLENITEPEYTEKEGTVSMDRFPLLFIYPD